MNMTLTMIMAHTNDFCQVTLLTVATATAGVERTVALATALVDWQRAEQSPTAGTVTAFGGAFFVGMAEM